MEDNTTINKEKLNTVLDIMTEELEKRSREEKEIKIETQNFTVKRDFKKDLNFDGRKLAEFVDTQLLGGYNDRIRTLYLTLYKTKAGKYVVYTKDHYAADSVYEEAEIYDNAEDLVNSVLKKAKNMPITDRKLAVMYRKSLDMVSEFHGLLVEHIE